MDDLTLGVFRHNACAPDSRIEMVSLVDRERTQLSNHVPENQSSNGYVGMFCVTHHFLPVWLWDLI